MSSCARCLLERGGGEWELEVELEPFPRPPELIIEAASLRRLR